MARANRMTLITAALVAAACSGPPPAVVPAIARELINFGYGEGWALDALGWSRQQAVDTLLAHTALSEDQAQSQVDRYIAWPGQACAYMIGYLEFTRLRAEAQRALGTRFDLRAFHDRVLEDGAMPLSVLRAKIEAWIRAGAADRRTP